jgi:Secretion system C-terminal sorting domain
MFIIMKNGSLLIFAFLFIFTNSIFAETITWDGGALTDAWEHPDNWDGDVVPGALDKARILDGSAVTLSSDVSILGLQLNGSSSLTINTGFTLTTTGDNDSNTDGVRIRAGSSLTINGTLNISGCGADGIDVDNTDSALTIGEDGKLIINNAGDHGIEITGAFSNSGDITISSPTDAGIFVSSAQTGSLVNNSGDSITISGAGSYGISIGTGSKTFTNNGIVTLSGDSLYVGSGNFVNSSTGVFRGEGTFGSAQDFIPSAGSTIAPGTSPGTLTFDDGGLSIDYSLGVKFEIEIDGTTAGTQYDQLIFTGNVDIGAATLDLIGTHTPVSPDVFTIIDVPAGKSITGTLNGLGEGGIIMLNGETLYISYMGGLDGNDITLSFDSPLPIELIDFNAQAMEGEVKLSWATATEINNDYFTLERSLDGRNFEAIAMIFGNGNTTEVSEYSHMDKNPERGLSYYRLKQTDYDRNFSYSDIETVEFGEDTTIEVYPTAVQDVLNVVIGSDMKDEVIVVIRDMTGREYESFIISSNKNKKELSLSGLVAGSYFVSVYTNEKVTTYKIIKL